MTQVFVLCTGRCGSTTFSKAASHITNFTSGHETLAREIGDQRLAYPPNHIEADNRLSWLLGDLGETFGDGPFFVHLKRERMATARSFLNRWNSGIIKAYWEGVKMHAFRDDIENKESGILSKDTTEHKLRICLDYVDTVNANIQYFLRDKTKKMSFNMEDGADDFAKFWSWIGARGDREAAIAEWATRHNATPLRQKANQ